MNSQCGDVNFTSPTLQVHSWMNRLPDFNSGCSSALLCTLRFTQPLKQYLEAIFSTTHHQQRAFGIDTLTLHCQAQFHSDSIYILHLLISGLFKSPRFFGGFVEVSQKPHTSALQSDHSTQIVIIYPQKVLVPPTISEHLPKK